MMEDLSGKSNEELDSIKTELSKQQSELKLEMKKLYNKRRDIDIDCDKITKKIYLVVEELKRRKDAEEAKALLTPEISAIEGFELLGEDELSIITKKMDRTDYRKHKICPRFYDFERICKEVIQIKQRYPKWKLTGVSRGGQVDTLPPYTHYRYEYKDEYGSHFDIGGLKLISI